MRAYLCAPLGQDRLKLVHGLVVGLKCLRLCWGEYRPGGRRMRRGRLRLCARWKRPSRCDRSARLDDFAPSHIHSFKLFDDRETKEVERKSDPLVFGARTHRTQHSDSAFGRIVTRKKRREKG